MKSLRISCQLFLYHTDLLYKNECQNWRNKINKAKKTTGFPADRLEELLAAFEAFKKEALQRKKAVTERTAALISQSRRE